MAENRIGDKKTVFFTGCFTNYYYPEAGKAAAQVLRHNGVEVIVPDQVCCALPMVTKGNIKGAFKNMNYNVRILAGLAKKGYSIVATCSSCSLMLKRDYPALLKSDDAKLMAENLYHMTEYLMLLHENGLLNTEDLKPVKQTIYYHNPCHLRAQQIGTPTTDLLDLIPGTKVAYIGNECCGMGGAYGYEKKNFEFAKGIASKLDSDIKEHPADRIVTDCGGCKLQAKAVSGREAVHPLIILAEAYDIQGTVKMIV